MKKYKIGNRVITADSPVEAIKVSKMLDSATEEIEYLTKEEEKAVDDYRKAIAGTTNPQLLELYKHILDEELEHIRELQEQDVEDCDMKDMGFQPDFGTIFTFSSNGNKEYIVTNTNGPTINNEHTFEYREYVDGKESGPTKQMRYATAKKDIRLKKL